jgi:hypothetical protein
MGFFPLSIMILQKLALLVAALYKFDDGVPCLVSWTRKMALLCGYG